MSGRLRVLFLAERYRALDEDRLLADIAPLECQRLTGPEPGVRQDADQRCVARRTRRAHPLDRRRSQRPDLSPSRKRSLADGTRRVRLDLPVLERALKDRSEQGERVADRNTAVTGGEQLRLRARDRLRPDCPELERAERRQDVLVQELPVVHPRLRRKLGCVRLTPGADHVPGERDSAHVHLGQRPELLPAPKLGTERDRVPLPVEHVRSTAATLPPPNPPSHRSVLQDPSLDLHAATPWLFFVAFKDATASRWSHSPALRSTPAQPRRTLTGKPWARLPAPFLGTTWGAGSLAHRRAKPQVRRGCAGARVCNRITHFVTHFPTHLNGSAAAPDVLCAAQSRSRRQHLIGGYAFGAGTRADRLDS